MDVHVVGGGGIDCNQFLAIAGDEAMVIDAGTGIAVQETLAQVRRRTEAAGARVVRVYVTHWHHDHTGGAPALARELGCDIVMPEAEAVAIRDGRADLTLGEMWNARQESHPVTGVAPGDAVEIGGESFEVLHTPGHTAGHTSLWHAPTRSLFAGDVVFSHGSFGRVDLPTGSAAEMIESLERLASMEVDALYPGHIDEVREKAHKHVELALSNARGML